MYRSQVHYQVAAHQPRRQMCSTRYGTMVSAAKLGGSIFNTKRCLLFLLPSVLLAWSPSLPPLQTLQSRGQGVYMAYSQPTRRSNKVGQVIQSEIADVIRNAHSVGNTKIPSGLQQLISIVDVDMSPDLRNARIKVSVIGERKDKISAVRWLQGNVRGLRHQLAQRNRHMKRIPMLQFVHVDVGAATDIMVKLADLRREEDAAALARGESLDEDDSGIDFDANDEDAWLDDDEEEFDFDDDDDDDDDDDSESSASAD